MNIHIHRRIRLIGYSEKWAKGEIVLWGISKVKSSQFDLKESFILSKRVTLKSHPTSLYMRETEG